MKKKSSFSLGVLLFLPLAVLASEPSAFSAGDVTSPNPYGLTSNEKKILQNNQSISEQYEGMRSIIEGYNNKIARMDERIRQLSEENAKLKEYAEESRKIQAENQEKVKSVLAEMGTLIDSINKNSVSKEKFDQLANEVRGKGKAASSATPADSSKTDPKTKQSATTSSAADSTSNLSSKDSATLLQEADGLVAKKSHAQAKTLYTELLKRNYKPAKVNFELGQIAYEEKSYKGAIEYYKTSIGLADKAPYTPTLLYNTGFSFEKLGKTKEAQSFYKALKETYPNSPEAKKVR